MGSRLFSPGPQEKRFAAHIDGLANAAGHADRHTPLKNYCKGLLLPGKRKSVEPMAARLAPNDTGRMHQSLHHLVAAAPWNEEEMLAQVRQQVLPAMQKHGPVMAWIAVCLTLLTYVTNHWDTRLVGENLTQFGCSHTL